MSRAGPLAPPPGYGSIVPLDRNAHRGLAGPADYRFAGSLHAIYVSVHEFFQAAAHYPIVFFNSDAGQWAPLVLTGLNAGENLFVDDAGRWRAGAYVPAYVRRYPFCTAALGDPGDTTPEFVVYVDEDALSPATLPERAFFDADGEPTEAWHAHERLIRDMEAARMTTEAFTARLERLELLEPFEAHAQPPRGVPVQIRGLFRVSEERLNVLPGDTVKDLMNRGELSRIYAHLMSLDHFAALLDLRLAHAGG